MTQTPSSYRVCNDPTVDPPVEVLDALVAAHARGVRIASICSGAFTLAATGLLDGKRATTHWAAAAHFRVRYPAVLLDPDVLYVDEGQVLTSAGASAGLDCVCTWSRGTTARRWPPMPPGWPSRPCIAAAARRSSSSGIRLPPSTLPSAPNWTTCWRGSKRSASRPDAA